MAENKCSTAGEFSLSQRLKATYVGVTAEVFCLADPVEVFCPLGEC